MYWQCALNLCLGVLDLHIVVCIVAGAHEFNFGMSFKQPVLCMYDSVCEHFLNYLVRVGSRKLGPGRPLDGTSLD